MGDGLWQELLPFELDAFFVIRIPGGRLQVDSDLLPVAGDHVDPGLGSWNPGSSARTVYWFGGRSFESARARLAGR